MEKMMEATATYQATYERMHSMMAKIVPEFELREKAKLVVEINKLKRERNAIKYAHL